MLHACILVIYIFTRIDNVFQVVLISQLTNIASIHLSLASPRHTSEDSSILFCHTLEPFRLMTYTALTVSVSFSIDVTNILHSQRSEHSLTFKMMTDAVLVMNYDGLNIIGATVY